MWWWEARKTKKNLERCRMTIEVALLVSVVSVAFSIFFGIKNSKKSDSEEIAQRIA